MFHITGVLDDLNEKTVAFSLTCVTTLILGLELLFCAVNFFWEKGMKLALFNKLSTCNVIYENQNLQDSLETNDEYYCKADTLFCVFPFLCRFASFFLSASLTRFSRQIFKRNFEIQLRINAKIKVSQKRDLTVC